MSHQALYGVNGWLMVWAHTHTPTHTYTCVRARSRVIHFRFPLTFSLICIIHCQHIASTRYVQELSLDVRGMTSFLPRCTIINHQLHSYVNSSPSRIKCYLPVFPFVQQTFLTSAITAAKRDLWECVGAQTTL